MPPFLGGGSMIRKVTTAGTTYADPPARFEAGTPAIAQAIGMASALRWLDGLGMEAVREHEREITDYALRALAEVPGLRIFGPPRGPERLGPVSFELEGVHAHDVSEILDRHGVAVRAGHHCAQPLMDRLGIAATARASFGVYTTPEEIDRLVEGLHDARKRLRPEPEALRFQFRGARIRRAGATIVWGPLRTAGRRVLPLLLAAERGQVEEGPDAAQRLDAAAAGRVGEEDAVAVAQVDVEREVLGRPPRLLEVLADRPCTRGSTSPCGA